MKIPRYWRSFLFIALGLTWSLPAGAVVIKNVQSGSVTMSTAVVSQVITSVNTAKTFVVCYNRTSTAGTSSNPTGLVTCELTDSTHLTITAGVADASETVVWYVAEFTSGVSVQRGLSAFGTTGGGPTAGNPTISAVDPAKSFPIITIRVLSTDTAEDRDEDWLVRAQFPPGCTSATCTSLQLDRNLNTLLSPALSPSVAWQVVTITDSAVQPSTPTSNNSNISNGNPTSSAAITAAPTGQTFVVFSQKGQGNATACYPTGTNLCGIESQYKARCSLCTTATCVGNSSTITCTRTVTGTAVSINSYAVQMTDCGSTVQSGNISTAATTDTTLNVALSPSIDPTRSVPFISVSGGAGTNTSDLDDVSWTAVFTSCTPLCSNLQLQRRAATTNTNATVSWAVVQFAATTGTLIDKMEIVP